MSSPAPAPASLLATLRTHPWDTTHLGAYDSWPQALRTTIDLIMASSFPMFVAWGANLTFLYNDAYAVILGAKHPHAFGQPFQTIWPEIWPDIAPLVAETLAGKSTYRENLPLRVVRNGYEEQAWFTFSYSPLTDDERAIMGMFCVATETTERVMADVARQDELERLRQLFEQAPGFMALVHGPDHVFKLVNQAYRELTGARPLLDLSVRAALPDLSGQGYFELLDQVYRTGEPFRATGLPAKIAQPDDAGMREIFVDFVYQPIFDPSKKVTGIFIQGNEVTATVQASRQLRESQERLIQLANTIPHLAWMANPDGEIHWYNDRWYDYTGTTIDQMRGWGWRAVHHPDHVDEVELSWRAALSSGERFERTFPLRCKDGSFRPFYTLVAPLRDGAGQIVQWFGTNTDLTEIENVQAELRKASRRKDEFLAMLAHELRNPLAPIRSSAQILQRMPDLPPIVAKAGTVISRQVSHLTHLVDDLLDVSRVTRGLVELQHEIVDMGTVVHNAIEQSQALIESRHHVLATKLSLEPAMVYGDHTRLVQITTNLLNNAAKYTQQGGAISVALDIVGDQVELSVADNGIGIAADLLGDIFELFSQAERTPDRAQGGLGLGLALVKSIAVLHGGTVTAASPGIGCGSTMTLILPRAQLNAAHVGPISESALGTESSQGKRILLVDDNVDGVEALAALLCALGHQAVPLSDPFAAGNVARSLNPDVFILDIGLPGISGLELIRQLRADYPAALFLALTGYGQAHDQVLGKAAGFAHYFVKPVDIDKLQRAIDTTR